MDENTSATTARQSGLIVGVALILGILADHLFFEIVPGLNFTVFAVAVVASFLGLQVYLGKIFQRDLFWPVPLLLFLALMVSIRANILLTFLNIVGCGLLLLLIAEVSVRGSVRNFVLFDYLKLLVPANFVTAFFKVIGNVWSIRKAEGDSARMPHIIRGILITAPVLILFTVLFSSADLVFSKYVSQVFSFDFNVVPHVFVVLLVAVYLVAVFGYAFFGVYSHGRVSSRAFFRLGYTEIAILLGSVNALFLAFILIQITYLFGGESNITSQGLTFAEYARKGFFELIAVATFSYLLLLATEKLIERNGTTHSRTFKIVSTAVVIQLGVIMISASMRLSLYENAFGFTTLRLYSHAFILLLGVVFVFLAQKILVDGKDETLAFRTFLAVASFLVLMNMFNPDLFIAKKNIERYHTIQKIDAAYLSELSADATPATLQLLDAVDEDVRNHVGRVLYAKIHVGPLGLYSLNYARSVEQSMLSQKSEQLKEYEFAGSNPTFLAP
ncbi:MAG: DUF4173 domain-containing protein [Patescibacteria group bacterium]